MLARRSYMRDMAGTRDSGGVGTGCGIPHSLAG
jgi:hypothetical protein